MTAVAFAGISMVLSVAALAGTAWTWVRQRGTPTGVAVCVASVEMVTAAMLLAVMSWVLT